VRGVLAARGFVAAGVSAGIKNEGLDVSIVDAGTVVPAAAVFTTSLAPAAPVVVGRRRMSEGRLRAVLLNSGCANASTGGEGVTAVLATIQALAQVLGCDPAEILACSTGPIGTRLPVGRVIDALEPLVSSCGTGPDSADAAARAIMTTDTVPKQAERHGEGYAVGGMAKGAGMLRPDMATMLAVITTDAVVATEDLSRMLSSAVDVSFNSLDIDGCMSTNDTVVAMASGASGVVPDAKSFGEALTVVCTDLAAQIARDAEGASRVVTVHIAGAATRREALTAGRAICDSALVRSSFYGGDPNWGRIVAALGASGVAFDPSAVEIRYGEHRLVSGGVGIRVGSVIEGDFDVWVRMGPGDGTADMVTTDLTPEYVRFNGAPS
jgi:glutamate N-acetyltransferase/amino-acid N-acetyltransferase